MKLVKYEDNWADEMDLVGFMIMTDQDYDDWLIAVKNTFADNENQSYYCGSNEEVEFELYEFILCTRYF